MRHFPSAANDAWLLQRDASTGSWENGKLHCSVWHLFNVQIRTLQSGDADAINSDARGHLSICGSGQQCSIRAIKTITITEQQIQHTSNNNSSTQCAIINNKSNVKQLISQICGCAACPFSYGMSSILPLSVRFSIDCMHSCLSFCFLVVCFCFLFYFYLC